MIEPIVDSLEVLLDEYPYAKKEMTPSRIERYVKHLSLYSTEAVVQGIDHFIHTDNKGFFPKIGQLTTLAKKFERNDLYTENKSNSPIDHPEWPELTMQRQLLFDRIYRGEAVPDQDIQELAGKFMRIDATLSAEHLVSKAISINL